MQKKIGPIRQRGKLDQTEEEYSQGLSRNKTSRVRAHKKKKHSKKKKNKNQTEEENTQKQKVIDRKPKTMPWASMSADKEDFFGTDT